MNQYVTGAVIRTLREKNKMTQLQLAEKLPPEQRKKQLGADRFRLMTWPGYDIMAPLYEIGRAHV